MDASIERLDRASLSITEDRIAKLREDFPEVFREGRVDFDALQRSLGEWVDPGKERFGLTWPGKAECMKVIQQPSTGTLIPDRAASVDFDATQNLIIEGDNLEVLKLLQKSYYGKIKMIYIDPPYNTGNEFIYPDNYQEGLQEYLRYTGQTDRDGNRTTTNTETGGRFHSVWLSMMYPRLFLARNLLRDDGFIFMSIDDGEVHNLRALANMVFGEENFIANVVWQKKYTRSNDAAFFSDNHDHILVYCRLKADSSLNLQPRTAEQIAAYSNPDRHSKGPWKATPLHAKSGVNTSPYTFRNGVVWKPPVGTFRRYSDDTMATMDVGNEIWFGPDGAATPSRKSFLSDVKEGVTPVTIWPYDEVGHNHEANSELKGLMGEGAFDNPKPSRLIQRMLELSSSPKDDDIILDFFAGSGTTAHAVMNQNVTDRHNGGGQRRFFMVQFAEPLEEPKILGDGTALHTIADITRERVRRAGTKIREEHAGKEMPDLGFRAYRLTTSNIKPWNGDPDAIGSIEQQLRLYADNIEEGRSCEDILTEILLRIGFDLAAPVERLHLAGKEVFSVAEGALLVCVERELNLAVIEEMAGRDPAQIICLDAGFAGNDRLKVNAVQTINSRARRGESSITFKVL